MDAERQLFSAQIELARARLSQLESYIDLYRALGGGWSEQDLQKLASR
jgi:multidrug efflux system outer membrane protein